jgi:streptogramin lyase
MFCRESERFERLRCDVALTRNRRWVRAVTQALALGATVALLAGFGSAFAASPEPASSATFTSIPIPNGTIFLFTPTVGPDGNIWFPMAKPASIVRVLSHPPYTVTEFPLADEDSYPDGNMVTGPDGNLWFAEQGDSVSLAGKIGRILPHPPYTITEFNTAHPQDVPRLYGLVVGPDRNIYYTETCCSVRPDVGGSVGRITPFGSDAKIQASVAEVVPEVSTCTPVATGTSTCDVPRYVTLGPDGNLWIAATFSIYRLTVPGYHLSQFPVPGQRTPPFPYSPFYLAFGIATGSDGNIWFTGGYGPAGNHIGRLSPRDPNNMTLYPVSTTNTNPDPLGITTGQDGNLYFAMGFNNGVGSINPFSLNKEVTDYTIPGSGVFVHGVTAGPCDNSIWVTDGGQTAIVRIQLPGPPFPIHGVAEDFGHPGFLCH